MCVVSVVAGLEVGPKVRPDIGHAEGAAWTALAEPDERFSISLVAASRCATVEWDE